jgi:hypothetical protein
MTDEMELQSATRWATLEIRRRQVIRWCPPAVSARAGKSSLTGARGEDRDVEKMLVASTHS